MSIDTVGTLSTTVANGQTAHDNPISGSPVRIGGRALTSDFTAVTTGDAVDLAATTTGKLVNYPYALPGSTWSYAAASGGIVNTSDNTLKAAGAGAVRNYLKHLDVVNGHATTSTDVQVLDGSGGTVLWRGYAQAAGGGYSIDFDPPLRGAAATAMIVKCGTTSAAVYVNATGFQAAE